MTLSPTTAKGRRVGGLPPARCRPTVDELLPAHEGRYTLEEAAIRTGLEPALIERLFLSMGFSATALDQLSDDDLELLRYVSSVLAAGFPLVALLQLVRV